MSRWNLAQLPCLPQNNALRKQRRTRQASYTPKYLPQAAQGQLLEATEDRSKRGSLVQGMEVYDRRHSNVPANPRCRSWCRRSESPVR